MCHISDAQISDGDRGAFASHDGEIGPISVDEFEGRMLCARGESGVDHEFCGMQVVGPVILVLVAEDAKVLFDFLIHAFGFTVALWMVSGGETRFDAEVLVQGSHETCCKLRAAIRVCLSRDAVESENVFVVQVSYTFG